MVALDVAGHEAQPRNAQRSEVVVIAQLPRTLARLGKVVDLDVVGQVRVGTVEERH
ncbi:hypothetical protein D3C75_1326950 [compost metagenome]